MGKRKQRQNKLEGKWQWENTSDTGEEDWGIVSWRGGKK